MAYRIPSDEEVVSAIQRVISKHHTITSQHRIKELVDDELKSLDKNYRTSGVRIRRLVLKSKYFHLEIDYKTPSNDDDKQKEVRKTGAKNKKGGKKKKQDAKLRSCPVCGSKVRPIKNRTLKGGPFL